MEQLIFEKSIPGRKALSLPARSKAKITSLPPELQRKQECQFPELSTLEVVRHFTALSQLNFSVDTQFYPLGSCTMKYNPKFTEALAGLSTFKNLHPLLPQLPKAEDHVQGVLEILFHLEELLSEITGMKAFTLQPLAGAHGELTGVMMIAAYHKHKGNDKKYIIVPDSAHGTNPATANLAGYEAINVPTDANGVMDFAEIKKVITPEVAGLMVTCPNTYGIFNSQIDEIAQMIHDVDGLMYYDGANLNAILGKCRPGDLGFDVMHLNTHKTFTTPHGGGGPGAGPVGVNEKLEPFLPISRIVKNNNGKFELNYDYPQSIGYVSSYYGNFSLLLRAYAYILLLGKDGLREVGEYAVLNANYVMAKLKDIFDLPYDRICMHECVFSAEKQAKKDVHAIDLAKFLIDRNMHPPTVYFPITVKEAVMIEPTETESKQTLDLFIQHVEDFNKEVEKGELDFHALPTTTPISRPDEVKAAREIKTTFFL